MRKFVENRRVGAVDDDESNLEFHFDIFFSTIETSNLLDITYNNEEECDSFSAKDRLLNMRLPKMSFDPLLNALKVPKPSLHRALSQLPIVTGSQRGKKKIHRKEKRKDRKDKDSKEKDIKSYSSSARKKAQRIDRETTENDNSALLEPAKYGELLALLIAKNIAENSVTNYLVTIALLLIINKEDAFKNLESSTIPIANLIAALFDGSEGANSKSSSTYSADTSSEETGGVILNPFKNYLLSSRTVRSKSITNSESSRFEVCSMDENKEETMSQSGGPFFAGAYSETGSTVGSTYAELGTETASVMGDEITEEELLAQALALSMIENMNASSQVVNATPNEDQPVQDQPTKSAEKPSSDSVDNADGPKESAFPTFVAENASLMKSLPKLHPLSTFGPFCCSDFWSRVYSNILPDQPNKVNNTLPVRHIIVSLLIVVANGIDCADSDTPSEANLFDPSSNKVRNSSDDSKSERFPNLLHLAPTPNPLKFALIEYLIEFLKQELISHCSNTQYRFSNADSSAAKTEPKDNSSSAGGSADTEWYFHLYFLVWCLTTMLKILGIHFQAAAECGVTLSSLSLSASSLAGDSGDLFTENVLPFMAPTTPFSAGSAQESASLTTLGLLQQLAECIGVNNPLTGNKSSPLFEAMNSFIHGFFAEKDIIDSLVVVSNSILTTAENQNSKLSYCFSGWCFRHHIRITAIQALTSGLQLLIPKATKRLENLKLFLSSVPIPDEVFAGVVHDSFGIFETLKDKEATEIEFLSSQYFKLYFLQKICSATLTCDDLLGSFNSQNPSSPASSSLQSLHSWSSGKQSRAERLSKYIKDESFRDYAFLLSSIQELIISRVRYPYIFSNNSLSLQWGEISFLRCAQLCLFDQYSIIDDSEHETVASTTINFNSSRCHPNLQITSDGRVATHQGPKLWATVTATKGFDPNSGTYEWVVRIDKCSKGHVFLGIVTGEASTDKDSYVGVDRGGWGLIGTRSLWHNKSKVVADYGNGFGTGSVITVRLDTDKGTLSFHTQDAEWGIAFENIPKVVIYPAFSLHEKDDQISVLFCTKVGLPEAQLNDKNENVTEEVVGNDVKSLIETAFISYILNILNVIDGLISHAENHLQSTDKLYKVLSHPLFCVNFPSVMAFLISSFFRPMYVAKTSLQLLPFLTIVAKRLSQLHDKLQKAIINSEGNDEYTSVMEGLWLFRSTVSSNQLVPQAEYAVKFDLVSSEVDEYSDGEAKSGQNFAIAKLKGIAVKNNHSINITGSQYGTRVKLLEMWHNAEHSVVEGRISLCGNIFSGRYKVDSGKMGLIEAVKLSRKEGDVTTGTKRTVFKSAVLCCSAVGKLASNLIVANQSSTVTPPLLGKGERSMSIDPADEMPDLLSESALEKNDSKESAQVLKWVKSNLFSGGFELDHNQKIQISENILSYLDRRDLVADDFKTSLTDDRLISYFHQIRLWWLQFHFPSVIDVLKAKYWNFSTDTVEKTTAQSEADAFLSDIIQAKNDGLLMDEYISLHAGQSSLIKIGGEPMQRARKLVMAVLVKHSGCSEFCLAEAKVLTDGKRGKADRPNAILMEIWRAGQRVMERTIRQKQESGMTFEEVAKTLIQKAEVLLELKPNRFCMAVKDSLMFVDEEQGSKDWSRTETGLDVQQDCFKLLSEAVEFLICPLQSALSLRSEMIKYTSTAVFRLAGFRSFLSLLNATDEIPSMPSSKLPPISSINLVSVPIIHVLHALREIAVANSCNYFEVLNNASASGAGHYLDGIYGVSSKVVATLQSAFEAVFESITQHLSRCTWAGNRDGQVICLSTWGILVKPDDHTFLNHVGIFRTLQTVLDDARNTISRITTAFNLDALNQFPEGTNLDIKQAEIFRNHAGGIYAGEILLNSNKRLAQLALCIVHGLASQVAYSKEPAISISATSAPRLQKIQSGPDTLSKSLFDLMYAELYTALKNQVVIATHKLEALQASIDEFGTIPTSSSPTRPLVAVTSLSISPQIQETNTAQDFLDGENYIYRILRLLYLVSGSKNCQKLLSSPKWLSVLISSLSVTGLSVQRRSMRLLRRLLMNLEPVNVMAYVPPLFTLEYDILLEDTPLTDEDIHERIANQNDDSSSAEKIIQYFLDAITVTLPLSKSNKNTCSLLAFLNQKSTTDSFAADSVVVLRILFGIPLWRKIISKIVIQQFDLQPLSRSLAAALAVIGGYVDRLRIGGLVTLKPFCLLGSVDNFATKLAAASHSCGMLVSTASNTGSVEVILMERGTKEVHNIEDSSLEKSDRCDLTINHTTNLAGSIPVRAVRLNSTEVVPCPDIPPIPCLVSSSIVNELLSYLAKHSIPWLKGQFEQKDFADKASVSDESNDNNEEIFELLLHIFTFKAVCIAVQDETNAETLFQLPSVFQSLVAVSAHSTTLGNLSVLESLEDRCSKLWASLSTAAFSAPPTNLDSPHDGGPSLSIKREASDSQIDELSPRSSAVPPSSLRDLAAILSPFSSSSRAVDSTAQAAALSQMLEMGLPNEWCEFALKRCNYNVEMAINMCLEHGSDMAQLIAEDANNAASREASARRHFIRDLSAQDSRPHLREERRGAIGGEGSGSALQGAGILAPRNLSSSSASALVRQLLDMGFPPSWCARAMASSNNDLDAALGWVLTHDGDPNLSGDSPPSVAASAAPPSSNKATDKSSESSGVEEESKDEIFNPLVIIAGNADIKENLTCRTMVSGFPSIGCRGYAATSGKWYYELTVLTAGCVQVGWVDTAFTGMADSGQGVGDDIHSWAFDGWRTYIWHETSADWGTRWAPGDVVGCAIDLSSKIMSFYLNGFGVEIGMGVAFVDFESTGGLFPCVSFNRNESVRFNFGSLPFKHEPPTGYRPFIDHILAVREQSEILVRRLTNSKLERKNNESPEDSFEECLGEKHFSSQRRYFQSDDSKSIQQESLCHFSSSHLPKIPSNRKEISKQLFEVAKDLCINYSRLSIFRSLNRASAVSESARKDLAAAIFPRNVDENEADNAVESILKLVSMTSCYTNRTKSYLQATSILPPLFQTPHNLGSIFSTGGYPMLSELQDTFSLFVFFRNYGVQRTESSYPFIENMIQSISSTMIKVVSREFAPLWRMEDKFCPAVIKEGVFSDADCLTTPSMSYAVWVTFVLMQHFVQSLSIPDRDERAEQTRRLPQSLVLGWTIRLIEGWEYGLRCPSVAIKICAMKILSYILQELTNVGAEILSNIMDSSESAIFTPTGVRRYVTQANFRLNVERNSLPVCSEYLQALLEFSVTAEHLQTIRSTFLSSSNPQQSDEEYLPFFETEREHKESKFNWEAISGRIFTDGEDGWDTLTGTVRLLRVSGIPTYSLRSRSSERHEVPPELMIGCKVARPLTKPRTKSTSPTKSLEENKNIWASTSSERSSDSPHAIERIRSNDETPPTTDSITRLKKLFEQSAAKDSSEQSAKEGDNSSAEEVAEMIGTVTNITQWSPGDSPGSAREITWEDGTVENIRWGAQGLYDAVHVAVKDGKIVTRYPSPLQLITKIASTGFGMEKSFGVILRVRFVGNGESAPKLIAIIEWPDFNATIFAEGVIDEDGSWFFSEKYLISGTAHSGWDLRFGCPQWQPGTTYSLDVYSKCVDRTDDNCLEMTGKCTFFSHVTGKPMNVIGDIQLQKSHLFYFDQKVHSNNTVLSNDLLSVSKTSSSGQGCAFGTIGFSGGVHFWEFKIEQAEIGSIFIGVSEKPDLRSTRLSRWMGHGLVSNRTSFETAGQMIGERVAVYGDHFHTGDIVGVLLDMNKGRLSFFLDGLKYGEHNITDLGEAFDNLTNPSCVKPKTLFPIVGISKSTDRVTLTPRWLSNVGANSREEYRLYKKAWSLLSSWSRERSTQLPYSEHMWLYRESWRNWLQWQTSRQMRIRTRCKISSMVVVVDISPRACVEASMKLGLEYALFSGDHVLFSKSSGRPLGVKEEAIILGAFKGLLWYRLDAQQSSNSSLMESSSLAWCLLPADVEGMTIVRRRLSDNSKLPKALLDIPLPRLPIFRGGLIHLFHESGAVVRDGLEIDTSDVLCTIPSNTIIYAIEKRMNASNINRYRVLYKGNYGWISEKMRGGSEEVMLSEVITAGKEQRGKALQELVEAAAAANIDYRIVWDEVSSLEEGVRRWEEHVRKIGMGQHLITGGFLSTWPVDDCVASTVGVVNRSFDYFVSISSTLDGTKPWSVEADMQLVELLSKSASKDGVTAQNLTISCVERNLREIDAESSLLKNIDVIRVIARAAILRTANQVFSFALPYININLPEEKLRYDTVGSDAKIDIQLTPIDSWDHGKDNNDTVRKEMGQSNIVEETVKSTNTTKWSPPCCARRLRSLRRLLFSQTKSSFFESILDATTTFTPMHQDEYEDPKEIKTIKIKRVRATQSRLISITNANERLKQSVFGQLHKELRSWPNSSFRRSYVGKGHGGQKRGFKVKFVGEGVNDYGGPYRAVFEQVVDEVQCDAVTVGGTKPSEKCLLPLLIPCPNKCTAVGNNQDKFILSTTPLTSTINQELMQFFGKTVGTAVRQNLNLALNFSVMLWRPLAKLPLNRSHLEAIDTLIVNNMKEIINLGMELERKLAEGKEGIEKNHRPEEWVDLTFSTYLPDGTRWALIPGGSEIPVNLSNWREYIRLMEQCHLQQSASMFKVFKDGLSAVVPVEVFPLFTAQELERLVSGNSQVDVDLIRRCTEYEDISPDSDTVKFFWEVLNEMDNEEKTEFLRFVWARSRLPVSAQELSVNFKLQGAQGAARESPDKYLPHAQTCFFSLSLPAYSSKEIMKEKLLYAIKNSPNMDADVRLHNAEGWAES